MEDFDKTIPPQYSGTDFNDSDRTIPGERVRKADSRFIAGDLLMNRYRVLAELGQGGMGVVYRCLDETAGIEVALKALPPELSHNTLEMEDIKDNFQLVSKLVHQNIAISKQLERDPENGNYYLIMECVEGEDLRHWIRRKRKENSLSFESVVSVISQVAQALDYAHEMMIIHRDIKPGNIMIDHAGRIKVLDFGLAAQIQNSMSRVSMAYQSVCGTGSYMAPEQWRGRAQGAAADQYALAVMTYEMLAGHLPFENGDTAILKQAVLEETPAAVSGISSAAQEALDRAMSKEPEQRFESCSMFVAALCGKKSLSRGTSSKWISAAAALCLIVAGGVIFYFAGSKNSAVPEKSVPEPSVASAAPVVPEPSVAPVAPVVSEPSVAPAVPEKKIEQAKSDVRETECIDNRFSPEILKNGKFPEVIDCGGIPLEMVKIKAGTFNMGSPKEENGRNALEIQHKVTLTEDFYIGKFEVTQEQYTAVTGYELLKDNGAYAPVTNITRDEAREFCDKLNALYADKLPEGYKFDLPTEAQWEYACRAETLTAFNNGSELKKVKKSFTADEKIGWFSTTALHTVGKKLPNAWGLFDMHGNAEEWCRDRFEIYSRDDEVDPKGARASQHYVTRGGSYRSSAADCRSAARSKHKADAKGDHLGFRLALVPEK